MSTNEPDKRRKKKPSKQFWMFLGLGLPLFILLAMITIGYMVPNGLIMLTTALGLFIFTLRKKNAGIRFTRTSFIALATCFFTIGSLVENPALWPQQIGRHVFKNTLIQPNSEKINELYGAFNWWLDNRSTSFNVNSVNYYGDNLTDPSKPLEEIYRNDYNLNVDPSDLSLLNYTNDTIFNNIERVAIADYFIRACVIDWTDDEITHQVSDHTPIPNEALQDWADDETWRANPTNGDLQAHDDCDGIAVVTVSFLRRLKQEGKISADAWIGQGKNHWFTSVYFNDSTPMMFFNHFDSTRVYCIYTDNNIPLLGQNVLLTLQHVFISDEDERDEFIFYLNFIMGKNVWILVIAAVLVAFLGVILFGYPRDYEPDEEKDFVKRKMAPYKYKPRILKPFIWLFRVKIGNPFQKRHLFFWLNVALISTLLFAGVSFMYHGILSTRLYTYTTMYMYGAIFLVLFILDRDPIAWVFKKVYKKVKGKEFSLYVR